MKWRKSEVISYLEEKITNEVATVAELDFYIDYTYGIKISRAIYNNLVKEMNEQWVS